MGVFLYRLCQCSWGLLQTLCGFVVFLANRSAPHFAYRGAVITRWGSKASVSLGMFVFVAGEAFSAKANSQMGLRLLVHEYGHSIQSLILGPLYLPVVGLPSLLWARLPVFVHARQKNRISYFSFYTEKWADRLGERTTKRKEKRHVCFL